MSAFLIANMAPIMFGSLIFLLPFMTQRLIDFSNELQPFIIGAGN